METIMEEKVRQQNPRRPSPPTEKMPDKEVLPGLVPETSQDAFPQLPKYFHNYVFLNA